MKWTRGIIATLFVAFLAGHAPVAAQQVLDEDSPVWVAAQAEAEPVVLEAVKAFDAALAGATVETYENSAFELREIRSDALTQNNVMLLVMFQDGRTVIGVFDLADPQKTNPNSYAVRLEAALVKALDAKFKRGTLEPTTLGATRVSALGFAL
jgi:hypothetical protein